MGKKYSRLTGDILWYLIGFVVPAFIGFIKTPIFTRYFSPEDYGILSIVSTTYSFVSVIMYSWIISCIYRFYNHYRNKNKLNTFYSNILFIYLLSSGITLVFCVIWAGIEGGGLIKGLVILNAVEVVLSQLLGIYMTSIKIEGRSFKYNALNIITPLGGFLILLFLTFNLDAGIDAMIMSRLLPEILLLVCIISRFKKSIKISIKFTSIHVLKEFINYGFPAALCNMSLLTLTSSDRYIIGYFSTMGSVGIYNQVYNISELSISALVTVFISSVNPVLLRELENNYEKYDEVLTRYTSLYIVLLLPFTVFFSLFSRQISSLLLGERFRSGYTMMPYVMITAFIYGMTDLVQDIFRFGNKLNTLIKGFFLSAFVNIILNIIFIPILGYQVAAVTTLVSYIILYLYYYKLTKKKYFNDIKNIKTILPGIIILLTEAAFDIVLRQIAKVEIDEVHTIVQGFVFLAVYYLLFGKKFLKSFNLHSATEKEVAS